VPMLATYVDDLASTGSCETLACHTLSAGRSAHCPAYGGTAGGFDGAEVADGPADDGPGAPDGREVPPTYPVATPLGSGTTFAVGWEGPVEHPAASVRTTAAATLRRVRTRRILPFIGHPDNRAKTLPGRVGSPLGWGGACRHGRHS